MRGGLCPPCDAGFRPPAEWPCPRCAAPLGPGVVAAACRDCVELRPRFAAALAGAPYAGLPGELLRRAKYGGDVLLLEPLARRLVALAREDSACREAHVVVPVPGVPARVRRRGFHAATLLAGRLGAALGRPVRTTLLERVGDPPPQASLPRTERRTAARGTVRVAPPTWWERALARFGRAPERERLRGAVVLLVDDVLTTGATADACARVLLHAGAAEVRVAVALRA